MSTHGDPTGILGAIGTSDPVQQNLSAADRQKARLKKASQDFESIFVGMMLKEANKPLDGEHALFGNSEQAKLYQDMMDDAIAGQISKSGSFGLGKAIYKSLEMTLPVTSPADSAAGQTPTAETGASLLGINPRSAVAKPDKSG